MVLFSIAFLQYFSTMPLYYKDVHVLSEFKIGLLMGMNGLLIAIFEMPLVKWLESPKYTKTGLVAFGAVLTLISFIVLNVTAWVGVLVIGMLFMTIGEMIASHFLMLLP